MRKNLTLLWGGEYLCVSCPPFPNSLFPDMMCLISTALGVQHALSTDSALSHVNLLTQGWATQPPWSGGKTPAHHCHLTTVRSFHSGPLLPSDAMWVSWPSTCLSRLHNLNSPGRGLSLPSGHLRKVWALRPSTHFSVSLIWGALCLLTFEIMGISWDLTLFSRCLQTATCHDPISWILFYI